ncbi:hypothetical protein D8770_22835 [Methylobacterium sp. DB1607]|nr:hypothetical protein [Methylobacterium sp. DB1607]
MTNAEKQKLHRQRIKAKLKQADDKVCAEEIEAFRKACDAEVKASRADPNLADYSLNDLLISMLEGDYTVRELQGAFLARAMGLPDDPWPGLTSDDVLRMTKGRTREAKTFGFDYLPSGRDADFMTKLRAAKHRAWLEKV